MNLYFNPLTLVIAVLTGIISAYLARSRGRNPLVWFFVGLGFGLIGVFAIFFFPKKKKEKEGSAEEELAPETFLRPLLTGPSDKFWYYLDSSQNQQGPMSFNALSRAYEEGIITHATYVWHEDLTNWQPLQNFFLTETAR